MRRERHKSKIISKGTIINYIISITLLVAVLLFLFTGLIEYPSVQKLISANTKLIPYTAISNVHKLSGIYVLLLGFIHIITHFKVLWLTTKAILEDKKKSSKIIIALVGMILVTTIVISTIYISRDSKEDIDLIDNKDEIVETDEKAQVEEIMTIDATITIGSFGNFTFALEDISTMRSDIFKNDEFSIFDIIVYLDRTNQVEVKYHFEKTIDSYVIDSINGVENWWYAVKNSTGIIDNSGIYMDKFIYDYELTYDIINTSEEEFTKIYGILKNEKNNINSQQEILIVSEKLVQKFIDRQLTESLVLEMEAIGFSIEALDLVRLEMQTYASIYNDGVYKGEADAHNDTITVEVTIHKGKILFIEVIDHSETAPKLSEVFKFIPIDILKRQSIKDVDVVSGATQISDGYISAVDDALSKAIK